MGLRFESKTAELLYSFFFPSALFLAGAVLLRLWDPTGEDLRPVLPLFGYGVFGSGAALGWLYNRSRAVFSIGVLLLAAWGLPRLLLTGEVGDVVTQTSAFLVPLNLLALGFFRERGVFTRTGIIISGAILGQAGLIYSLSEGGAPGLQRQLTRAFISEQWTAWTWMGQPALAAFAGTFLVLIAMFFFRRNPVDRGLIWSLPAAFWGFQVLGNDGLSLYYFATAGFVLQTAVAEHAYRAAYRDELTGLPGRRALNEFLPQMLGRYAIAMVDIDHFKNFNDKYGHDVGDQVLQLVASKLARVSGGGRVFRYGGEEFTVVFPGLTKGEAKPFLEFLRESVEQSGFALRSNKRPRKKPQERRKKPRAPKTVSVTISIGVAENTKTHMTQEEVIKAADKALYRAKEGGRNQVKL
jgi:diguanylate cyclase (GGDEF)-like protein